MEPRHRRRAVQKDLGRYQLVWYFATLVHVAPRNSLIGRYQPVWYSAALVLVTVYVAPLSCSRKYCISIASHRTVTVYVYI